MRLKIIICFLFVLVISNTYGQELISFYDGYRTYTGVSFVFDTYSDQIGDLDVAVVKKGNAGYLVLSGKTIFDEVIRGPVTIFLDNNEVIKCVDRKQFTRIDDEALSQFNLTPSEMHKLRKYNIEKIIFRLASPYQVYPEPARLSAVNLNEIKTSDFISLFLYGKIN